jgi:UDP-N-acetylglucosamine 1-carboxyvinyltransferase
MPYSIKIQGGIPLVGTIPISGAKNAALPLMCASLLSDQPLFLSNVANLADIRTMCQLLKMLGVNVEEKLLKDHAQLTLTGDKTSTFVAPYEIVKKMRASILVLGPMLTRFGQAKVSLPGGCAIGTRPVDIHLSGLEQLGAKIDLNEGYIFAKAPKGLVGCRISMPVVSVTATENLMMAAVLAKGETVLINAAKEPEIIDLAECLKKMGAIIDGAGSEKITIQGVTHLNACNHRVIPDRLETSTYLMTGLMTKGNITATNTDIDFIEGILQQLEKMGAHINTNKKEGWVSVKHPGKSLAPIAITTQPYPGVATDLQAQFMALMTLCDGCSVVSETIFENRFMHVPELCRLGANISIQGSMAHIHGVSELKGAHVMATDLRASICLVMAGLAAKGETHVHRLYHLDRGYEKVEEKLSQCGAIVERYQNDIV